MGREAIYKCQKCGNEFKSREGGGFNFFVYRCINCDNIKSVNIDRRRRVPTPTKEEIGVCKKCGGELRKDLKPMCPVCKSREAEVKQILANYD